MTNKFKYFISIIILLVLTLIGILAYRNVKPSATAEDIAVEAIMQINNTGHNTDKEYRIDITINKKKDSHMIIYPYATAFGAITYNQDDKDNFYIPGSVGSDFTTETAAIGALRDMFLLDENKDNSLVGFWFPDKAGEYSARIYVDQLEGEEIANPVLVCVYTEKKLGKEFSWTKIIPIIIE